MNKWYFLLVIPFILTAASCGSGGKGDGSEGRAVKYVTIETFEQESNCDTSQTDCTIIHFSYPRIVGSGNKSLNDTLDAQIQKWLTGSLTGSEDALSPEAFSKAFISDYEAFRKEYPENSAKWFIRRKVDFIANNNRYVTLQLSEENYLGGAHGMSLNLFANFSFETGERINLEDLVAEGQMEKLEQLAEGLFRQEKEIPEGQSLQDAGYFYMEESGNDSPFFLTNNFAITREGLLFYYNPYDIAPYSMGATILKVPFREIAGTLKTDGVLRDLL